MSDEETAAENPNRANYEKHGSLGNYTFELDARGAEKMHQMTAHPDSIPVAKQNKKN